MNNVLQTLRGKNIHLIGITGAEGSALLRFLLSNGIDTIVAHDFLAGNSLEKSYKLYHKGVESRERDRHFKQFLEDVSRVKLRLDTDYLCDVRSADAIFVPQSWRLYRQNTPLWEVKKGGVPFYSLTRMYLDFAPAKMIAVTGTVGKGSVANLIYQILKKSQKPVHLAGNDTWMMQNVDKLFHLGKEDILVLEISHRQLLDGFTKAPPFIVITNIYPNHLDEVSWEEYKNLKFSLPKLQGSEGIAILNFDFPELRELGNELKSKVLYFSSKSQDKNTKNVQKIYDTIMSNKFDHYPENILAAGSVVEQFGVTSEQMQGILPTIPKPPARMEYLRTISGIDIFDDLKSTTPWATLAGLHYLLPRYKKMYLICGGETKGISYISFCEEMKKIPIEVVILASELAHVLQSNLPKSQLHKSSTLEDAFRVANGRAKSGECIVVSPAAAFFYRDFIAGKKSIRKLATSLLPKAQE
ncbi:hypothetical protein HYW55_03730 [Candidatus Gottesmanbacteria bacterium]|nr:hypothetical protein [Candidatus Gottesmanbacteria bacterium]